MQSESMSALSELVGAHATLMQRHRETIENRCADGYTVSDTLKAAEAVARAITRFADALNPSIGTTE
jgi:hypothetical protein